ncbi:U-box domain-containing protein 33 [Quercus suber]|uniref:U-box domain-containing protein 33 n=1 Tax=Quercus suber TaxID=58331 RepID=UPI0032DE4864
MELLQPSHPPHHGIGTNTLYGFPSSGSNFGYGFHPEMNSQPPQLPYILEEAGDHEEEARDHEKVHVAVGKSMERAVALLQWSCKNFRDQEICVLHVHQPSHQIPTLLGKLPASKASSEVVAAYRKEEWAQTVKLLGSYVSLCNAEKVKASFVTIEADQVQKGIVDLVSVHGIRKLVMGAVPETCVKVKKSSRKANYAAKNAPSFCEIWFVKKGKHMWTREASEVPNALSPSSQPEITTAESLRSKSFQYSKSNAIHPECVSFFSDRFTHFAGSSNFVLGDTVHVEEPSLPVFSHSPHNLQSSFSPPSTSTSFENNSPGRMVSAISDPRVEEMSLYDQLTEAKIEAEASMNEVFAEIMKRKKLEMEAIEAISKIKVFESAHAHEVRLRKEGEDALRTTIQEQEKVLEEREEVTRELQRTMRNVALLDSRAQEANRRCDEAVGELNLIQASISTLRQEKQRIRQQKTEALRWLERWRRGQAGAANCNGLIGFVDELPELAVFSLSDLQTATCNFSESFKLGQGGYGSVYKGEMLGRTVAIRKFNPHSMQGPSEFQLEVQVLGKLQHPHLVTLLGACPEAWSLVYEYLPNGSLQNHLFRKSNNPPLLWNTRTRIIAEISSALCFLHSSQPEKIVHGDLKPDNVLLDADLSCKICEFGICRLVTEENLHCPSFRRGTEPKGAFTYTDPEFQRIGVLTPKSDIYSFGLIILQLLTGRLPTGLAAEVRKADSCGKLASILDSSAGEWPTFVARRLVDLGLQCCQLSGRDRPDMTPSLVRELEQLHVSEERPVPSYFLCPILQEIMHDPQVAADGFTYEGEALRGWLENGHDTSPMTNLKLSHLHLTPNNALRLAIQDWLCKC